MSTKLHGWLQLWKLEWSYLLFEPQSLNNLSEDKYNARHEIGKAKFDYGYSILGLLLLSKI